MGRFKSFVECDAQTKDLLWDALYHAAKRMLNEAKKDLKMLRMVEGIPECPEKKRHVAFWREHLSKDMAKYHEFVRCREEWWWANRILRLPVDRYGCPLVK